MDSAWLGFTWEPLPVDGVQESIIADELIQDISQGLFPLVACKIRISLRVGLRDDAAAVTIDLADM